MKQENDSNEKSVVLTGNTPIHVKFIGWLVIVCAGGFGGWIWWASSINTKLDVVISNQTTQRADTRVITDDISRLKEWRIQVDTVGSPMMVKRVDAAERNLIQLSQQFDLHVATTTDKNP